MSALVKVQAKSIKLNVFSECCQQGFWFVVSSGLSSLAILFVLVDLCDRIEIEKYCGNLTNMAKFLLRTGLWRELRNSRFEKGCDCLKRVFVLLLFNKGAITKFHNNI